MDEGKVEPAAPLVKTIQRRDDGLLSYDGIAIGSQIDGQIVLNLGWLRAAGLGIKLLADPEVDTKRGGIVLER